MAIKKLNLFEDESNNRESEREREYEDYYEEKEDYYNNSPKYHEQRRNNRQVKEEIYDDRLYDVEEFNDNEKHYNYYHKNRNENSRHSERYTKRYVDRTEDEFNDFEDTYFRDKTPSQIDNSEKGIKKRSLIDKLFLPVRFLRGGFNGAVKVSKHVINTLNEQSQPKNRSMGLKNKFNKVGNSIGNGVKAFKQNTKAQVGLLLGLCGVAMVMVFMVLERG